MLIRAEPMKNFFTILVINPKVSSTRLAVYRNSNLLFLKTIRYSEEDLIRFTHVNEQKDFRKNAILKELRDNDIQIQEIDAVIARGGLVKPLASGVYLVNERMKEDLEQGIMGTHVTNLGGILADEIATLCGNALALIADPAVVDEMDDISRFTGHPLFQRRSVFHALNHKVVARKYAKALNLEYEDMNLIVVHVGGGGTSVGAHRKGKVVDVNQAFDGGGPFSIERSGSLPTGDLVRLCFSGKYTEEEVMSMLVENGGVVAYLGIKDMDEVEARIESGDKDALFVSQAMAYQISKQIGSFCMVFDEKPDAVILSGDIFHNDRFTRDITHRIQKMGTVVVYPDEDEIEAMAINALWVLKDESKLKFYE